MANQAMAWPTVLADCHCNAHKPCRVIGRLPQQLDNARQASNARIEIAAKVLVQFKNLFQPKGSPGQCLDDTNISQHLSLPGGLLRVARRGQWIRAYKRKSGCAANFLSFAQLAKRKVQAVVNPRLIPSTSTATHCVECFYYIQALLNCLLQK